VLSPSCGPTQQRCSAGSPTSTRVSQPQLLNGNDEPDQDAAGQHGCVNATAARPASHTVISGVRIFSVYRPLAAPPVAPRRRTGRCRPSQPIPLVNRVPVAHALVAARAARPQIGKHRLAPFAFGDVVATLKVKDGDAVAAPRHTAPVTKAGTKVMQPHLFAERLGNRVFPMPGRGSRRVLVGHGRLVGDNSILSGLHLSF